MKVDQKHKQKRRKEFTKDAIRQMIDGVVQTLRDTYSVRFILLFGSVSTGQTGPLSDVDLAVYLDPAAPRGLDIEIAIGSILERALRTDDLDVVILNDANPALKFNAVRTGTLLFCVDEGEYEDFYVRAASEFYDYSEFLEKQYETAKEIIRRDLGIE